MSDGIDRGKDPDLDRVKYGNPEAPVEDLFLRRWSPRAFAGTPIDVGTLKAIFSAGQWAASSFNEQPWRFVVGHKGDSVWQRIFESLVPGNQSWTKSAPVLFASFAKKTSSQNGGLNRVAQHDVGAASAQIALEATSLGLHTHGMAGFDPAKLALSFAAPDDFEPVACWAMGYRGDPAMLNERQRQMELSPRKRKPLSEIVFSEWGSPAF
jgi:nitroreductase